jgi:hypothetical protein
MTLVVPYWAARRFSGDKYHFRVPTKRFATKLGTFFGSTFPKSNIF